MSRLSLKEVQNRVIGKLPYSWLERFVGFMSKKQTGTMRVRIIKGKVLAYGWDIEDKAKEESDAE